VDPGAATAGLRVVVTAPSGAPAVPVGFSPDGVVAAAPIAGAGGSAVASGVGAGAAAAGGGISAATIALVGGGAVVAGGGIAIAASGGSEETPQTCEREQVAMSQLVFQPDMLTCTPGVAGTPRGRYSFVLTNSSAVEVAVSALSGTITNTSRSNPNLPCQAGGAIAPPFTPLTLAPNGGTATVTTGDAFACFDVSGFPGESCGYTATLQVATTCGVVSAPTGNTLSLHFQ
jgi:hypothetical protein